jgi:hypothetical protein
MYSNISHKLFSILVIIFVIGRLRAQPMTRDDFNAELKLAYKNLTFSGVDLQLSGVKMTTVPFGYAFAYFDKSNNNRWLLINEARLFNKYLSQYNASSLTDKDLLKQQVINEARGLMAHEWSHHFLGHTFGKITRINERDADFMTGRILYEYFNYIKPTNILDSDALSRSLAVTNLYDNAPTGSYHLPKDARSVLIQKGFATAWLLRWRETYSELNSLQKEIKKLEIARVLDSLNYVYKIKEDSISQLGKIKWNLQIDSIFKETIFGNYTLIKTDDLEVKIIKLDSEGNKTDIDTLRNTIENLKNKYYDYRVGKLKDLENEKEVKTKKVVKEIVDKNIITRSNMYEPLYNFFYLESKIKNKKYKKNTIEYNVLSAYRNGVSESDISNSTLNYKLQGGIVFNIDIGISSVKILRDNKDYKAGKIVTAKQEDLSLGLKYAFYFDSVWYFLDSNYHLWTETKGAPFIRNRLFLQDFKKGL